MGLNWRALAMTRIVKAGKQLLSIKYLCEYTFMCVQPFDLSLDLVQMLLLIS